MKNDKIIDEIIHLLTYLAYEIKLRNRLNLSDLTINSENFFKDLMNICYRLSLKNANTTSSTVDTVDLIDEKTKFVVQITSSNTPSRKIKDCKEGFISNWLNRGYKNLEIFFITDDLKKSQKDKSEENKDYSIKISDLTDLFRRMMNDMNEEKLQKIYDFISSQISIPDASNVSFDAYRFKQFFKKLKEIAEMKNETQDIDTVSDSEEKKRRFFTYWKQIEMIYKANSGIEISSPEYIQEQTAIRNAFSEIDETTKDAVKRYLQGVSVALFYKNNSDPIVTMHALVDTIYGELNIKFITKPKLMSFIYHSFFTCTVLPNSE